MAIISKTLGGDRLGTGNRMKQEMHDFFRSNKNLSCTFGSTMAAGVLYPCYTNIGLKGDTFDIDANAFVRTIPTIGPVYGSFKLQVDFFQVPIRLYMGILHNNTVDIARKMNQVYIPKVMLSAKVKKEEVINGFYTQINPSSLMRYLNISGVGRPVFTNEKLLYVHREFNALPMLAYYDIFKNYYSNKQESNAYVITPELNDSNMYIDNIQFKQGEAVVQETIVDDNNLFNYQVDGAYNTIVISGEHLDSTKILIEFENGSSKFKGTIDEAIKKNFFGSNQQTTTIIDLVRQFWGTTKISIIGDKGKLTSKIKLTKFPLENIDNMRKYLLTQWDLGTKVVLSKRNQDYLPYNANYSFGVGNEPYIKYPLNGLVLKTYQSDLFNNWLDTEWVNEITTTSAIDVSNGSFTLDMLNFKKKLYDHLNRLAISGGTYDDWQEATYGDKVFGKSEKPIFCGGLSSEIEFDEVVSTAASGDEVLGTIGGRGTLNGRHGGNITIKVGEASIIMGIVSITPRLMYNQGNSWYNTELDTIDDLHKPIFDRIGFQDLMVEQMAWWDTIIDKSQGYDDLVQRQIYRKSAGKQPAWINYATDIDRVYGDFANDNGTNYMVLTRHYEQDTSGNVADVTTYIDPQKFNYAFAYQELDAQNFWTFIRMKIHARRKMSNTQIPNV